MKRLLSLFICLHDHVSWPIHHQQVCLDCGARRSYTIGSRPGRWSKDRNDKTSTLTFVLEKD